MVVNRICSTLKSFQTAKKTSLFSTLDNFYYMFVKKFRMSKILTTTVFQKLNTLCLSLQSKGPNSVPYQDRNVNNSIIPR